MCSLHHTSFICLWLLCPSPIKWIAADFSQPSVGWAAAGGRKNSRLNDYCVNCFHLGHIMVCILVISTIIYKSLCPLALLHCCWKEFPRELTVNLSFLLIHHLASCPCHFIYPIDQKHAPLLIINVCTLYLRDLVKISQLTKTSVRLCLSEVGLVAISKWDVLDVVKYWKRVELQMWWAGAFRNYFNYTTLHATLKASLR